MCVDVCGCVWMCVDVCRCVWMCEDVCGCVWMSERDRRRLLWHACVAVCCSVLYVAVSCMLLQYLFVGLYVNTHSNMCVQVYIIHIHIHMCMCMCTGGRLCMCV